MPLLQNDRFPVRVGGRGKLRLRRSSPAARLTLIVFSLALGLLNGCSGSDTLTVPTYTPERMAQDAMAEYDTNHDGYLDAKELERCPSLKSSLESMGKAREKRLSTEDITEHIRMYVDRQVALKEVGCHVLLDGRPLEGATVKYVPEKFMGSAIKPASGVSDSRGIVVLTAEGEKLPGVQPGFYRVQVAKKSASGQETIPARYNQDTILGIEISPHMRRGDRRTGSKAAAEPGTFRLSSK